MNQSKNSRWLLVSVVVAYAACASAPKNTALTRFDLQSGYRIDNVLKDTAAKKTFVILSFSGGGTRAAALSYGVLEKLEATPIAGGRTLLDEVDVISSVSGGSFTSAYYALYGKEIFTTFQSGFLNKDVEGALFWRLFNPINWIRLASGTFDRIDMAAEYYDEEIFKGATFARLLEKTGRPFVMINATDMSLGCRFEFTQDQFDLLYSDLSKYPIARAVAASSAFPVLLSPIRVVNHAAGDGFQEPVWIKNGLENRMTDASSHRRAVDGRSYVDQDGDRKRRPFIHLLDGGIADNIGLRGPLIAASTTRGGAWSILREINKGAVKRVVIIAVDAKTDPATDWDQSESSPGLFDVLSAAATKPMDNYSSETIQAMHERLTSAKMTNDTRAAVEKLVQAHKPDFKLPRMPHAELSFIHVSFDDIKDPKQRSTLKEMPTSFSLEPGQVKLLREAADQLLEQSKVFQAVKKALQ